MVAFGPLKGVCKPLRFLYANSAGVDSFRWERLIQVQSAMGYFLEN